MEAFIKTVLLRFKRQRNISLIVIFVMICGIGKTLYLAKTVQALSLFVNPHAGTSFDSEDYGSFTSEDAYSYDGKLVAHQKVENEMIVVEVKDSETGELAGSFSPARAWDFWGLCWENDSYNIWTQSADIGVYCWRYQDGTWECDYSHPERPEYIISKYDKHTK